MTALIKVLIVDDSALARQVLSDCLSSESDMLVIATAEDPFAAADILRDRTPDVIMLDIEMPRMDGLTFLKMIMRQSPIATIICSSMAEERSRLAVLALEYGAVDVIAKPSIGNARMLDEARARICDAVRAAAIARLRPAREAGSPRSRPKQPCSVLSEPPPSWRGSERIVVMGASTGGPEALRLVLAAMPKECPAIAVVQHMPEPFTATFAQRLDQLCTISVKQACDGDAMANGQALIAPGNRHMRLRRSGGRYYVELNDGPVVSRHRPSVDVLFRSAAQQAGCNAVGVLMTGMGNDGAQGLLDMKLAGAYTLAQDESTSVVYGMPCEAARLGASQAIVSLERIAEAVLRDRPARRT